MDQSCSPVPDRRRRAAVRALAVASGVLFVSSLAGAQAGPATTPEPLDRMRSDLRRLVTTQEAHFAEHAAYARTMQELAAAYRASEGVAVELANAGPNAYGAIARMAGRPGSCTIAIGDVGDGAPRTDLERKRSPEGEPTCDGDGQTERGMFAREAQARAAGVLSRVAKYQERHFGRTGAYAAEVAALPDVRLPSTITVTIELATATNREPAFLAIATDARYPGFSCVLASGWARFPQGAVTQAERRHAGGGSTAVCDTFR